MKQSDIPQSILDQLKQSQVVNIESVGRRGIANAAFSIKEIREISNLDQVELYMMKDEIDRCMNDEVMAQVKANRAIDRRTQFLLKNFKAIEHQEHYLDLKHNQNKKLILRFMLSPSEVVLGDEGELEGMMYTKNTLNSEN